MTKSNCPNASNLDPGDIACKQLQVVEVQGLRAGAAMIDLNLRQIDAHDTRRGCAAANGMRLPPAAQPISSTRAVDTSATSSPKRWAIAAKCPGADWGNEFEVYGVVS